MNARLSALSAQRGFELLLFAIAPALASASVIGSRTHDAGEAVVVFATMVAVQAALLGRRQPFHVMPLACLVGGALAPAVGLAAAAAMFALLHTPLDGDHLAAALFGAWLILLLAAWLDSAFEAARPVRMGILGSAQDAAKLKSELDAARIKRYEVVGFVPLTKEEKAAPAHLWAPRCLGRAETLRETVASHALDLLVMSGHSRRPELFEEITDACLAERCRVIEASALYEDVLGHVPLGSINSTWFHYLMHPRYHQRSSALRRIVDLTAAALLLLPCAAVTGVLAVAVRLSDGGPGIYRQRRVGERGREFEMFKLRTMRVDAEPDDVPVWQSGVDDPRITRIGALLRRTHLDELPQVWNLLKGDMTLVGPRPERPGFVEDLAASVPYYDRRHLVKPGITGWAQVRCGYAGSDLGSAWKVCHDLYFLKHRSLLFEVLIVLETLRTVVVPSAFAPEMPAEEFILGGPAATRAA
jgi:exopolysaccharide biosynthesis polyprenyl glycosylphosphotransferase